MKRKMILSVVLLTAMTNAFADISVSDVKVFSGYPWKEVVIGYTITGKDTDVDAGADAIQLEAMDNSAKKTYRALSLTGAELTEGRHVLRWDAASEGAKFSSPNVVFSVSIVRLGVRLWADGPYWAECNVGATKPEECGYYFWCWWGDTIGYKRNAGNNGWVSVKDSSSFSFSGGECPTWGKSNSQLRSAGYIDATGNLVAAHDAATAHLGALWRMPTDAEFSELINNCDTEWTSRNGVFGRLVKGRGAYATKSIFLPAAGYGNGSYLYGLGSYGYYWSSSPCSDNSNYAWSLYFDSDGFGRSHSNRGNGRSVRPVRGFAK